MKKRATHNHLSRRRDDSGAVSGGGDGIALAAWGRGSPKADPPAPAAAGSGSGDFFVTSREPGDPERRRRAREHFPERRRDLASGGRKRPGTVELQFDYSFGF